VTGAAGFIGSHLCRRLVAEGHDVVALDDLSEGSLARLADVGEVRFVEADVLDGAAVTDAARGCDAIFHLAAKRSVQRSMADPSPTVTVNAQGTLSALLAAREAGAVVVSSSSSSVYGDQEVFPVHEGLSPAPRSPYAASKLAGEVYCAALWRAYGVPAVSLRYFNVYGPGQDPAGQYAAVVPLFVTACLTGSRPVVHGDGRQARDFTYVDDAVEANLLAARALEVGSAGSGGPAGPAGSEAAGRACNVSGGAAPTSVLELLGKIAALCGVEVEALDPEFAPPRPGDIRRSEADVSLAGRLLGYRPRVGIDEGLARTVEAFRAAGAAATVRPA
jgi:UDP-glucose 4-epimerase